MRATSPSCTVAYAARARRLSCADADLHAWRALDALRPDPGRWGSDPVFFYGFDELTALERDAIETLARIVGVRVTLSLNLRARAGRVAARAEAAQELRPLAERVVELPALDEHYEPGAREALHHLERLAVRGVARAVDPGTRCGCSRRAASGPRPSLSRRRCSRCSQAAYAAEEIVVVHDRRRRPRRCSRDVFDAVRDPARRVEQRLPFGHTALGRGVLALARCALLRRPRPRSDLIDYLRTPGRLDRPEIADAARGSSPARGPRDPPAGAGAPRAGAR